MADGMGIFELPAMIEPNESMGNLIVALIGIAISMTVAFILTIILYKDKMEETEKEKITEVKSNKLGKVVIGSSLSIR